MGTEMNKKFKVFVIATAIIIAVLVIGIIIMSLTEKKRVAETTTQAVAEGTTFEPSQTSGKDEGLTEAATETAGDDSSDNKTDVDDGKEEAGEPTDITEAETAEEQGDNPEETAEPIDLKKAVGESVGSKDKKTEMVYESIKFTLPENWTGSGSPDQNECYFFNTDHAKVMLNRQHLPDGVNLNDPGALDGAIQGAEEGGFNSVEQVETIYVGRNRGYVLKGIAETESGKLDGTIVYCQVNRNIYTFIFAVEEGYSYDEDIEGMIDSIDINH
jgi:hypothetical protein